MQLTALTALPLRCGEVPPCGLLSLTHQRLANSTAA